MANPKNQENPWACSSGGLAHPDSPVGGGGPGRFTNAGPLGAHDIGYYSLPHPKSRFAQNLVTGELPKPVPLDTKPSEAPPSSPKLTVKGVIVAGGPLNDATITLVNEAAKTESNKRYIAYENEVRVGGSIAWRANNPGNLRSAPTQIGSAPGAVGNFAVFATLDDGRAAQKALYLDKYGSMTVKDAVTKLTTPSENDTAGYLNKLKAAGIDLDKDVKSQIDKLMPAIEANEGLITGQIVPRAK